MIGWGSVTYTSTGRPGKEAHRGRSEVVHASALCHRMKAHNPSQVWVKDDRVWLLPYDRSTAGMPFRWCSACSPRPALPGWMRYAHCRGTDSNLFFPGEGDEQSAQRSIAAAKAMCAECGVVKECREWALSLPETAGVWGGLSENEREVIRSERCASV